MRALSDTLKSAQKAGGEVLCKIVLTQQGDSTTHTYGLSTTNRILAISRPEQEWSQTAQVAIDNQDGNLTSLALEGYIGVISFGYATSAGDEYSASAPLTVIAQKTDSMPGRLTTSLSLAGLFNLWGEQEATEHYTPEDTNGDTVKTILDAIAGATMTGFTSYPAHTITYDTGYDDSIINTFTPKDYFSVAKGESRLSAFKKAMSYLKCKSRVRNDSGVATPHIFQPTITGDTYDYEYDDTYGDYHNFFDKSVRTRLVLPNKVVVKNHPDHSDSFSGSAADASSYAALGNQYYTETVYARPSSNAQCDLIAAAVLQGYQIGAEKGHGIAMMNVGQEVMDYVKITDSRANDTRIGNIGFLNGWYSFNRKEPTRFGFEFRFGNLLLAGLAGTVSPRQTGITADGVEGRPTYADLRAVADYAEALNLSLAKWWIDRLNEHLENAVFKSLAATERFRLPRWS